jgi:hypothetical protein
MPVYYVFLDLLALALELASRACGSGKRPVTLKHFPNACHVFQSVDVLCVVAQKTAVLFQGLDESMRRCRSVGLVHTVVSVDVRGVNCENAITSILLQMQDIR